MPTSQSKKKRTFLNPRSLQKKLIEAVHAMGSDGDAVANVGTLLRSLVDDEVIPVIGGRIWVRDDDEYRLIDRYGGRKPIPEGFRVRADEEIFRLVRDCGSCFVQPTDPAYNRELEAMLGVRDYAAISFGPDGDYLLSLDVTSKKFEDRDEILSFLSILRHVVNQRFEKEEFESMIREARDVQTSILPKTIPSLRDYDIWGESHPAEKEKVGGDLFDLIPIDDGGLVVVIADASGHGLPAALMARDVRTAVHMGVIGEIKVTRMVRRINRIVCDQAPTGRFISMFYGEIDRLDQLIYTAAGHPALLLSGGEFRSLREGGPVLGVHPEANYARGGAVLRPGDILFLYTDGLNEARDAAGEVFGEERLRELLLANRHLPAREIVRRLLGEVARFSGGVKDDDQTLVVVKRRGSGEGPTAPVTFLER